MNIAQNQNINITEITNKGLSREFRIDAAAQYLVPLYEAEIKKVAAKMTMPGFRAGKVPLATIKNKHGETIQKEIIQDQIQNLSKKALGQLRVFGEPEILNLNGNLNEGLSFTLKAELYPDISIPDVASIVIDKPVMSDITPELRSAFKIRVMLDAFEQYSIGKDEESSVKDSVFCCIDIYDGDKKLNMHHVHESYYLGTQSHLLRDHVPGILHSEKSKLLGQKIGSIITVNDFILPQQLREHYYDCPELQGLEEKKVNLKITIEDIKRREPEIIDDQHIAEILKCTVDQIDKVVLDKVNAKFAELVAAFKKIKLFDYLESMLTFEVPHNMLELEINNLQPEMERNRSSSKELRDKDDAEIRHCVEKYALRRIRIGMLLSEYATINQIKVTDAEFQHAMWSQISQLDASYYAQALKMYASDPNLSKQLAGVLLEQKAVYDILSKVQLKDMYCSFDELETKLDDIADTYLEGAL